MLPSSSDLIYFYEVAKELNVSRAAKKLYVSQPSLSFAIKRLEELLNATLFVRHPKGVTLTPAGYMLFENFEQLLAQWNALTNGIKDANQQMKGKVTIGCYSTINAHLSEMNSALMMQYPELEIHFKHGLSKELMQNIVEGHIDIGILAAPYPQANIVIRQIAQTEFAFWAAPETKQNIDIYTDDLLILADLKIPPVKYLLNKLKKMRKKNVKMRLCNVDQIEALASMAIKSHGLVILPSCYVELNFVNQLEKIEDAPTDVSPLNLVYREDALQVVAVNTVLKGINQILQSMNSKWMSVSAEANSDSH